jgi:nitrous oxide reductase accessory protein NosL
MKKILLIAGAVALLAAACNSQQTTSTPTGQTQNQTSSKSSVDGAINSLNTSVDGEQSINSQSDSDVVNSDSAAVNGYTGVSNANY